MANEQEFGRVRKSPSTEIVVRQSDYRGMRGVDIREYVTTSTYTGWTKSGIRIPEEVWNEFAQVVGKVKLSAKPPEAEK
jgi:hypothetical protein